MSQKHFLLKGTFILTAAGILTRVMGFFYRILFGRRNRSVPADLPGLYPCFCRYVCRNSDGACPAGCRSLRKKAACQSPLLSESCAALLFVAFFWLSFSDTEKSRFSCCRCAWRTALCLPHFPDGIRTSFCCPAQLRLWLFFRTQTDSFPRALPAA